MCWQRFCSNVFAWCALAGACCAPWETCFVHEFWSHRNHLSRLLVEAASWSQSSEAQSLWRVGAENGDDISDAEFGCLTLKTTLQSFIPSSFTSDSCKPVGWVGAGLDGVGIVWKPQCCAMLRKMKVYLELSPVTASICVITMVFLFCLHRNGIGLEFAEAR